MNTEDSLNHFEPKIQKMTKKLPRSYKPDAQQELRLLILQLQSITKGYLNDFIVLTRLKRKLANFCQLERSRGIKIKSVDLLNMDLNNLHYNISLFDNSLTLNNHLN